MNKAELLNNKEFKKADGSLPIIYITSDDDVVKIGGIINAPMVGRIYFSEVKNTITKDELLANKEFICASEDSEKREGREFENEFGEDEECETLQLPNKEAIPVKRKPGRPKKSALDYTSSKRDTTKKRGRKKS